MNSAINKRRKDDLRNQNLYREKLATYGQQVQALNWGSFQSQQRRFQVIADAGIHTGCSLLDVGCGLADFKHWLDTQNIKVQYSGIDITPEMIECCQQRYPELDFFSGDVFNATLGIFDYVVASGIFYLRQHQPLDYLLETVSSMFEKARCAVVFNSLSSWKAKQETTEFYADPLEILQACRQLSERVVLRHDYHPHDFTIYLYKS